MPNGEDLLFEIIIWGRLRKSCVMSVIILSEVIEEARWSKGDKKRPARAHRINVLVTFLEKSDTDADVKEFIEKLESSYELLG